MALGLMGFGASFSRCRPDIVLVLGDRSEMHAAAVAALPFTIPVAHIHGGELSLGAIDDALRHSITKLSHLHFVSTNEHGARVIQMGEEAWRVIVSGAPALDRLAGFRPWSAQEIELRFGVGMSPAPLLVTFHPTTLEPGRTDDQCAELLAALDGFDRPIIVTSPNADAGGRAIAARIADYVARRSDARLIDNAGNDGYFSLMAHAAAMVGNSSSGLVESPSFRVPVVNIGTRQQGRLRARNVIDVGNTRAEIASGIQAALSPSFRASLATLTNPYGTGHAARAIVDVLRKMPLDDALIRKRFQEPVAETAAR
jgi:UDP-hydrolysing UDP-N-acetyl-D-glucosamine 2-epimerase